MGAGFVSFTARRVKYVINLRLSPFLNKEEGPLDDALEIIISQEHILPGTLPLICFSDGAQLTPVL